MLFRRIIATGNTRIKYFLQCVFFFALLSPSAFLFAQQMSVPVRVSMAVEIEMVQSSWYPGTVIGRNDSRLGAEVDGRLIVILDVGDQVEEGTVIAQIEPLSFELRVAEAEAEIIPLAAKLDFYRREAERLAVLAKQNNAAKNRLDEVKSNRAEYTGRLKAAKARLAQARDQLDRTLIKAPFTGVITERFHSVGERVEAGEVIVRLVNISSMEIQVRVSSSAIAYLRKGTIMRITDGITELEATVRALVPVGDDISRLYELRLDFEHPDWTVGYAVRVAVPLSEKRKTLAVHRDALVIRQKDIKVFKVNANDVAEAIVVRTGIAQGDYIEVIGDIYPDDRIIVRGNERLSSGQSVLIQEGPVQP